MTTKSYIIISDPWDSLDQHPYADTVFETENIRTSKVLDQHGNPYSVAERKQPIGFDLRRCRSANAQS